MAGASDIVSITLNMSNKKRAENGRKTSLTRCIRIEVEHLSHAFIIWVYLPESVRPDVHIKSLYPGQISPEVPKLHIGFVRTMQISTPSLTHHQQTQR